MLVPSVSTKRYDHEDQTSPVKIRYSSLAGTDTFHSARARFPMRQQDRHKGHA